MTTWNKIKSLTNITYFLTYISAQRYESYITKHAWIKMQKKTTIKSLRKPKMKSISTAVYSFCLFVESGYWDFQSSVL